MKQNIKDYFKEKNIPHEVISEWEYKIKDDEKTIEQVDNKIKKLQIINKILLKGKPFFMIFFVAISLLLTTISLPKFLALFIFLLIMTLGLIYPVFNQIIENRLDKLHSVKRFLMDIPKSKSKKD